MLLLHPHCATTAAAAATTSCSRRTTNNNSAQALTVAKPATGNPFDSLPSPCRSTKTTISPQRQLGASASSARCSHCFSTNSVRATNTNRNTGSNNLNSPTLYQGKPTNRHPVTGAALCHYLLGVLIALVILFSNCVQSTSSDSLMMCPVPLPCHCIGDETIYCAFKRMKDLPYFLEFTGVWHTMNLSDNLLPKLPGNKFVGGRIRLLDLSRNIISDIHAEAFVGLSDLETLELSYNYLSEVSGEALSPLVDLRTLKLRYNRFSWVAPTTFAGITRLQHLDMTGNDLTTVPTAALRPLTHLKVLKLRNNKIKQIHGYAFEGLPLETLDLGDNESPVTLDSRAFCGQEPKVSHEERNVMEWDGMYTLFLDHNGLSFIDPCIAKLVWTLTTLDVSGNPLRCDCRLYMFRNWGTRTTFPHAQCDSPVKFAGEMVDNLDQSRFNCSHREQYARCDNLCVSLTPTPSSSGAAPPFGGLTGASSVGSLPHIMTVLLLALAAVWTISNHLLAAKLTFNSDLYHLPSRTYVMIGDRRNYHKVDST